MLNEMFFSHVEWNVFFSLHSISVSICDLASNEQTDNVGFLYLTNKKKLNADIDKYVMCYLNFSRMFKNKLFDYKT
jgi:hypothetical protein